MHIAILMFSRGNGGIEQAFIDYCEGLNARGHRITAIIQPGAKVTSTIASLGIDIINLRNWGEWDIWAARRLRQQLETLQPDVIIAGSNRAMSLSHRAVGGRIPIIGVTHNYSTERLNRADAAFAITQDLSNHLIKQGVSEDRIFRIPNMVRCHELPRRRERNTPPVIGSMGRFVAKKGFDIYIHALKLLRERGYQFQAVLGGSGEEEANLKKLSVEAGLTNHLKFVGWVADKKAFFSSIDVFCLPSLHEPFGIVLLEAFMHGVPSVATDSEGPRDIVTPNYDALLAQKGSASALADALAKMLDDTVMADSLAANAFAKTKTTFSMDVVAERIEKACETVLARWKAS